MLRDTSQKFCRLTFLACSLRHSFGERAPSSLRGAASGLMHEESFEEASDDAPVEEEEVRSGQAELDFGVLFGHAGSQRWPSAERVRLEMGVVTNNRVWKAMRAAEDFPETSRSTKVWRLL